MGSSLVTSGLSFSGFKIPKFFKFEFFRFQKIGPKTRRVFDFMSLRENFDQNLAKMHHFFGKISTVCIVQNWIWLSFNFRVFFEFGVWQSLKIEFFSSLGLKKYLKLIEFLSLGKLDQALLMNDSTWNTVCRVTL